VEDKRVERRCGDAGWGRERESRLAEFLCGRHMPKCTSLSTYFLFLISLELMPKRSSSLSNSQKKTAPVVNTHDALWSAIDKNECTKANNISKEEREEKINKINE
jgi:hypothetical protein